MPAVMLSPPTGLDLLEYLAADSSDPDAVLRAYAVLDLATQAARGYTRGRGFDDTAGTVAEDLASAIVTAAARAYTNPRGMRSESIGSYEGQYGGDVGWTMSERLALDRWRQRVA